VGNTTVGEAPGRRQDELDRPPSRSEPVRHVRAVIRGRREPRPVCVDHDKPILRLQFRLRRRDQTNWMSLSEEFLLSRPLLTAIRRTKPTVLLIDETDRPDIETRLLLECCPLRGDSAGNSAKKSRRGNPPFVC